MSDSLQGRAALSVITGLLVRCAHERDMTSNWSSDTHASSMYRGRSYLNLCASMVSMYSVNGVCSGQMPAVMFRISPGHKTPHDKLLRDADLATDMWGSSEALNVKHSMARLFNARQTHTMVHSQRVRAAANPYMST